MLLIVRSKDQLKYTVEKLVSPSLATKGFAVSKLSYHKLILNGSEDGIIITSPSAALAVPPTRLPLYCIGERTANEARSLGHRVLMDGAGGDAADMAKSILERYPVQNLVHAAGDTSDEAWYHFLTESGFSVEKREVYTTEYVKEFDADTLGLLQKGAFTHASFFSVNGVNRFKALCTEAKIDISKIKSIAFSQQIAEHCAEFASVVSCSEPTLDNMKAVISKV